MLLEHPGEGGLFLWGAVPAGVDVDGVVKEAFRQGILLVRGATFAADGARDPHIRFNAVFSQQPRVAPSCPRQPHGVTYAATPSATDALTAAPPSRTAR